jgi:hypothetical protein
MHTLQSEKKHILHSNKARGSNGDDAGPSGFPGSEVVVPSFPKLVR